LRIAISTAAYSMSGGVRFFRIGFLRLISCSASSSPKTGRSGRGCTHHLAGLADVPQLLGQFQQPDLRSDNLLLLDLIVISGPPKAPLRKPTSLSG
jgi:hypothetical protein